MKLNFLFLSLLISTFSISAQTIQFTDLSEMSVGRGAITSAFDGENIYVCNGFSTQSAWSGEVEKYNVATNSWSIFTDRLIPKRFASAAVVGDKLYVFNGQDDTGAANQELEVVDLTTGNVNLSTKNPWPGKAAGIAVWEGKIYSFGGSFTNSEFSNKLSVFDPISESWNSLLDMPFSGETKGEIINGKLYVFGGWNGAVLDDIHVYDISENTWTAIGKMPNPISAHATTMVGSKIWLVGDFANLTSLAYFDTADNSFSTIQSNMEGRRHGAAENVDGNLVVIGGNTESSILSSLPSVQSSDVTSSTKQVVFEDLSSVFPNPVADVLNIETTLEAFEIFDTAGKLVKRGTTDGKQIDVSDLVSGHYILTGVSRYQFFRTAFIKK